MHLYVSAVAVAVVLGAVGDVRDGRWTFLAQGRLLGAQVVFRHGLDRSVVLQTVNRIGLASRIALPVLVVCGIGTRWCAIVLTLSHVIAYRVAPKSTTAFIGLCCLVLSMPRHVPSPFDTGATPLAQYYAVPGAVLLASLYINGAVSKLRSEQFRSGATLAIIATHVTRRTGTGNGAPGVLSWCSRHRRLVRSVASIVIVLELILPAALSFPQTILVATVVGIVLHALILVVQPVRLLPFQVATLGTYACFWALVTT